jgi:hypothetical protein
VTACDGSDDSDDFEVNVTLQKNVPISTNCDKVLRNGEPRIIVYTYRVSMFNIYDYKCMYVGMQATNPTAIILKRIPTYLLRV